MPAMVVVRPGYPAFKFLTLSIMWFWPAKVLDTHPKDDGDDQ